MIDLVNKNFLITGGSSGLGKATANYLIKEGANVAITGRDVDKLHSVAKGIGAFAIHADVSKTEEVVKTYASFLEKFGRLDGLINNAGIGGHRAELTDLDMEQMRKIFDVNVFGATMMAQHAAEIFKKQQHGEIINIASTAASKGYPTGTAYVASKFALRGMTQCWQQELRRYNVRVVLINPSEVPTAFGQADRKPREDEPNKLHSEDIAHAIVSTLKMDRRGYVPELTVHATNPF
ncbi:SDR family oxidoreductase [Luteibaculum oceani]|uniref:SDR family oxidoreductase n=1 Tax=Luteibaculum oceani TaxID=1294296 RepID=A0A5C6UXI4_9FLAO|nr:SDR family oxidoreductase [Luteibaculum oceani]TXC76951.1 SDR family oxidoreductase [Luteibaculum oceani]